MSDNYLFIPPSGGGFSLIITPFGTDPSSTTGSNLTLTSSDNSITITGNSLTNTIDIITSSGEHPGGSPTQIQYNNSGSFGGVPSSSVDSVNAFLGLQNSTPYAPLHAVGAQGASVPAPASASVNYTLDPSINSPSSYAVTQINAPAVPTVTSTVLTYMDTAIIGAVTQNTLETGYIANGQTITYKLYTYQMSSGTRVVTSSFGTGSVTDTINDGVTPFGVDLSGIGIGGSLRGVGIILYVTSDQGWGPYWVDIGLPGGGTFSDTGFTSQDPYVTSNYQALNSNWSVLLAQYKNIGAGQYRTAYQTNPVTDDNSGAGLIVTSSWSAPTENGYVIQGSGAGASGNGFFLDIGSSLTIDDYGQNFGGGDLSSFSSVSFPYFNTGISDGSEVSATQNDSDGSYTANGSSYLYTVYEYETNTVNGVKYITSGYSFPVTDNNSGSTSMGWDIVLNAGTGSGRIITVSVNGGPLTGFDMGSSTSVTDAGTWGAVPSSMPISGYSGLTRNYSAYGFVSTPKYSSTHNNKTFTDTNPVDGYLISHVVSGFGNATGVKILDTSLTQHVTPDASVDPTTTIEFPSTHDSNMTVTPATVGYTGTGQTFSYQVFSSRGGIYSLTGAPASVTLPNDSQAYTLSLSNATVSGATYKAKRTSPGSTVYQTYSSSPFQDDTTVGWASSSTLTPNYLPTAAIIAERATSNFSTDPSTLIVRTTDSGSVQNAGIELQYGANGTAGTPSLRIGTTSSGHTQFNSYGSGIFDFANISGSAHTRFQSSQAAFNLLGGSYEWLIEGISTPYPIHVNAASTGDTVIIGDQTVNTLAASVFNVKVPNGKKSINIDTSHQSGGNLNLPAFEVTDSGSAVASSISNNGRGMFGFGSSAGNSVLTLGIGSGGVDQLTLVGQSFSFPSPSIADSINSWDGYPGTTIANDTSPYGSQLMFTDKNQRTYQLQLGQPASTNGNVWFSDSHGNAVASGGLAINTGLKELISPSSWTMLIDTISLRAGTNGLSIGSGSTITGNIILDYVAKTSSGATGTYTTDVTSGTNTQTLATAVGFKGKIQVISNSGTGTVTVATTASQTIRGAGVAPTTSWSLTQYHSITVQSDGANWLIIAIT